MLTITTNKGGAICYLEKGDGDGGEVMCYLKLLPDGSYAAHREWFSDPAMAKAELASADAVKVAEKLTLIDEKLVVKEPIVKGG